MAERDNDVASVSALGEPTRRTLYDYIARAGDWISRDAAADAVGIERGTAAHHLERMAADGLLDVDYRRLSGRQGPGAGRPAKLYRRARRDLAVSLPPRDYELAGRLLAVAADRSRTDGTGIADALDDAARDEGHRIAEEIRSRLSAPRSRATAGRRRAVIEVLESRGFEPVAVDGGTIVLRNCPFHRLAQEHTELICGMNRCLLGAALAGVGGVGLVARLEPEEGRCCVKLHPPTPR
jgi:predicted ArsR family transcriptional regulator